VVAEMFFITSFCKPYGCSLLASIPLLCSSNHGFTSYRLVGCPVGEAKWPLQFIGC
jgi:hypothetical protein